MKKTITPQEFQELPVGAEVIWCGLNRYTKVDSANWRFIYPDGKELLVPTKEFGPLPSAAEFVDPLVLLSELGNP